MKGDGERWREMKRRRKQTNGHDTVVSKILFGEVVDELAIDKAVDAVVEDFFALLTHSVALSGLNLCDLLDGIDLDLGAIDLDLVRVHGGVCDEDLCVLDALWLANTDLLLEDETLLEIRVKKRSSRLFDDVDGVEISASLETQDGVDAQVGKVLLVGVQHL